MMLSRWTMAAAIAATLTLGACSSDSEPTAPPPPPPPTTGTLTFRLDAQSCAGWTTLVEFFVDGQSKGAFTMQAGTDRPISDVAAGPRLVKAQQKDDLLLIWDFQTVSVVAGGNQTLLMNC